MFMRVFVTGGTGKLGKMLVLKLQKLGHEVRMLVRRYEKTYVPKGCISISGDLSNISSLEVGVKGSDVVLHLAGLVDYSASWEELYDVNVQGTKNLIEVCSKYPIKRFVHISSTAVYGKNPLETPTTEKTPTRPTDNYGKSKLESERVIGEYFGVVPSVILRPSVIYGPTYLQIYSRVLKLLETGDMFVIGNGNNVIPFVHESDVCNAIIKSITGKSAEGSIYNISENTTKTQIEIYKIACAALGVNFKKKQINEFLAKSFIYLSSLLKKSGLGPEDIDVLSSHRVINSTKIEKELEWIPKIKIEDGISEIVNLYLESKSRR